jgi:hypothetical protein
VRRLERIDYAYARRLQRCVALDKIMLALALALKEGLRKYESSLQHAMRQAESEYKQLWTELVGMARFPESDNPYISRESKHDWAMRVRVRGSV